MADPARSRSASASEEAHRLSLRRRLRLPEGVWLENGFRRDRCGRAEPARPAMSDALRARRARGRARGRRDRSYVGTRFPGRLFPTRNRAAWLDIPGDSSRTSPPGRASPSAMTRRRPMPRALETKDSRIEGCCGPISLRSTLTPLLSRRSAGEHAAWPQCQSCPRRPTAWVANPLVPPNGFNCRLLRPFRCQQRDLSATLERGRPKRRPPPTGHQVRRRRPVETRLASDPGFAQRRIVGLSSKRPD